jgi:repressor LexA
MACELTLERASTYTDIINSFPTLLQLTAFNKLARPIFTIVPGKRSRPIPILGTIEAGFPSPAEEELIDVMTLDEYLIPNKEATYMLQVKGDSMIDAGIRPGDIALVERGADAKDGDIVVAEVDGQWTMKYLRKRAGRTYLEPANKKYKPIYPEDTLKIAAVLVGLVRKYP